MLGSRTSALAVLAGGLLITLAACGVTTTGGTPTSAVTSQLPATTAGATAPASTAPATTAPASAPAPTPSVVIETATSETSEFVTPSGNIGCAITTSGARCDIGDRSWTAPPKPASCPLDYGNGVSVGANGAQLTCAGDTLLHLTTTVLAYGHGVRNGPYLCVSQSAGMRCDNETTKHGFTLAKEAYTLF